jgi:pyruvate dehydrogenase E1 component beta subunit
MRTILEAICEAMSEEMRNDESIYLMGEEVAEYNGAYKASRVCLQNLEKSDRYSIAELGFTGMQWVQR